MPDTDLKMSTDAKLVSLAGVILFAVGSILPWASMGAGKNLAGFSTPVFPLAALLTAAAVAGVNTEFKFSGGISLAASVLSLAVVLYTFFTASNLMQAANGVTTSTEYGLMISLLGSIAVCISAVMGKDRY